MFRIPGIIPISIYPFFWVVALLIGWVNTTSVIGTVIWIPIILVSILVHEFGHALTAMAFGQKARIDLVAFGGVTQRRGGKTLKLWQEFVIVLNGPLAGFLLAGIAWWVSEKMVVTHPGSLLTYVAIVAFWINLFWTILNLLPVQPMDGGKLLSIILESIFGLKGTKIALFISLLLAAILGLISFTFRQYFVGAVFMMFAYENYKIWSESLSITEEDKDSSIQNLMKDADNALRQGKNTEALEIFQNIREKSKAGLLYQAATESAAHLLAEQGELKEAYEMISSLGKQVSASGLNLFLQLAYQLKQWEEAVSIGDKAYKNRPSYQTAFINAAANAALGKVKQSIGWIQCAINDGLPYPQEVLAGKDFDAIRNDPAFREFLEDIV